MKFETTQLPGSRVELLIQLDSSDVSRLFDTVYRALAQRGSVHGFRPGKAPKSLIRRHYGEEAVRDAAWAEFIQERFPDIIEEAGLDVIDAEPLPTAEELKLGEDSEVEVRAFLTLRPQAILSDYRGLKLMRPVAEVSGEEIGQALAELRESYAEEVDADHEVVDEGDIVQATVRILIEGQEGEPEEREQSIEVGSGHYDPPIDEKLRGHQVGEVVQAEKTLPEDYEDAALAGKKVTIEAKINRIKAKQLPELDDDFARKVDEEKYADLAALRTDIAARLAERRQQAAHEAVEAQALDQLLQAATIELPKTLLEHLVSEEREGMLRDVARDGLTLEAVLETAETTQEQWLQSLRARVELRMKVELLWEALMKQTQVEAAAEEIEAELLRYAQERDLDVTLVRQAAEVQPELADLLRRRVLRAQALAVIVEASEIEEVAEEELGARLAAIRVAREAALEPTGLAGVEKDEVVVISEGDGEPSADEPG